MTKEIWDKAEVKPQDGEPLLQKHVNCAFIGTDLEQRLRAHGYDTLVIVGLTTPHCVSTTTRMAGNLGFRAFIVADATAAFDLVGHDGRHYRQKKSMLCRWRHCMMSLLRSSRQKYYLVYYEEHLLFHLVRIVP